MNASPPRLDDADVLMLDMDGTVLDLAYDNFMWLTLIPGEYARHRGLAPEAAKDELFGLYRHLLGSLEWYCLDHWSDRLGIDVVALHREHRERIDYLPGAQAFLEAAAGGSLRLLLVTNSHRDTLDLKTDVTRLDRYFDGIHSAHDLGYPKEDARFWEALAEAEGFDPGRAVFVDDTSPVLRSARDFGIATVLQVLRPDTSRPQREAMEFDGIGGIADLG